MPCCCPPQHRDPSLREELHKGNHWTFTCPDIGFLLDSRTSPPHEAARGTLLHLYSRLTCYKIFWFSKTSSCQRCVKLLTVSIAPKRTRMRRVKSFTGHRGHWRLFSNYFYGNTGCSRPFSPDKSCCSLTCNAKLSLNCPEIAKLTIQQDT